MKLFFITIIAVLFGCFNLKAQRNFPPVFEIKADTGTRTELPDKYWQILEDPSAKLTIAQVSSPAFNNKFHINNTRTKGYDYNITNYWLRYSFKNTLNHTVRLTIRETVAHAYLYTRKADSTWAVQTTGSLEPLDKRDGLKRLIHFVITIEPGQQIAFYEKDVFDFWLTKPKAFVMYIGFLDPLVKKLYINNEKYIASVVLNSIIFGLLAMAALVNLLFYRVVKEKMYLFFSLFLFGFGLNSFIAPLPSFFGQYQYLYNILGIVSALVMFFFLMHFIRKYLETSKHTPKWDKFLIILSWLSAGVFIVGATIPANAGYQLYILVSIGGGVFILCYFPVIVGTMLVYLRINKATRAGIFAALPAMLFTGIAFSYLLISGELYDIEKVPYTSFYYFLIDWIDTIILISVLWLVVIFSWILFKRYQGLQQSIIQSSLDREIEKSQLIEEQNEKLERQVEVRTAELKRSVEELKATQQQLIQSEKLASLGELTAGIAHEIQNPLNFVNNFSEVSMELAVEIKDELKLGNIDEVIDIVDNIEQNLEKIIHHGKRADAIVKNMLQHSRNNSGEKQPTNINALADEYFRLSYHGLRAKDKAFNSQMFTKFDETLPKVTLIPQDIGRVMLNLFNNAFYAVQQRKLKEGADYKPEVTVSTATEGKFVVIKVRDNGIGIPANVKEKILQPFFTTKPAGEGTGLGLSLSYDILVKGHGGTLDVDSKEGEYTEFTIKIPA